MRVLLMVTVFLLVDLGVSPLAVRGQSLTEAAAKEKERRAGKTTRVITDDDLAKAHQNAPPAEEAPAAAAATPGAAASPTATPKNDSELRAERRKAWSDRREAAEKELTALNQRIQELQRITSDRRVYAYDPNRAKALQELKESQEKLPAAQQKLDDLVEEGRREGF